MVRSLPSRPGARLSLLAILALAVLAGPLVADASGALTAREIRIGKHPGKVRVVVDFTGGRVLTGEVVASDPDPFRDGRVSLPLTRRGVRSLAAVEEAHGVRARIASRSNRIIVRLSARERRFKYVTYFALRGPHRLVIDLIESRPPGPGAVVRRAPDGCLVLSRRTVGSERVGASGRASGLFENALVVRLRGRDGRVVVQEPVTAASGAWTTSFAYPRRSRQAGTLEAVALSAKDGTLECLVQSRVRLGG